MSQDLHARGLVPSCIGACDIENSEWMIEQLHGRDQQWWVRYFVAKYAKDEDDQRLLLAIILGDPLS